MPLDQVIPKTPTENLVLGLDFRPKIPAGKTITSATIAAYDEVNANVTSQILTTPMATIEGTVVLGGFKPGGTSGETYRIIFTALLSDLETIEDGFTLAVTAL